MSTKGVPGLAPEKQCDIRFTKAQRWRLEIIKCLEAGMTLRAAQASVGVRPNTYAAARGVHKDWAAEVDAAKVRGKIANGLLAGGEVTDEGTHSVWVAKYLHMTHNPAQLRIAQAIDDTRPGEITMVLLWPEAGKSTSVLNWATRILSERPNERVALVSESQNLTRKFVGRLKQRLTDEAQFSELISRYGPYYEIGQERENKPWSADFFRVARCTQDEADYSVQARSWNSAAYGSRIDTLIIDDVQSRRSLTQTETIYDNLRQTYFTRGKEMRIVVVGTRVGTRDIYERMIDDDLVDRLIIMPAMNAEGEPTVPEAWSYGKKTPTENIRAMRKRVGDSAWFASYQQNPLDNSLSTFGMYITRCLDEERPYGPPKLARAG